MSATVRPAGEADIPALFAVRTAVRENRMDVRELARAGVTPATVAAMLRDGVAAGWLAEWTDGPTGFAMARSAGIA